MHLPHTFRLCLYKAFTLNDQPHLMLAVFLCLGPSLRRGSPSRSQTIPTFDTARDLYPAFDRDLTMTYSFATANKSIK